MLLAEKLDLRRKILLLIGNGPSSWWIRPKELSVLRTALKALPWPDENLVVAACNRTAAYVSSDVAGAVDRDEIGHMLDLGVHHNQSLVVERESFEAAVLARGARPPGLIPGLEEGRNLFFFERGGAHLGTGYSLARALVACKPQAMILVGFDGGTDARTRWQGTPGYPRRAPLPSVLDVQILAITGLLTKMAALEYVDAVKFLGENWLTIHSTNRRIEASFEIFRAWAFTERELPCPK